MASGRQLYMNDTWLCCVSLVRTGWRMLQIDQVKAGKLCKRASIRVDDRHRVGLMWT